MRFEGVSIAGFARMDAPHRISPTEMEEQLSLLILKQNGENWKYRPRKLWCIMGQYFGQKLFFNPKASGSRVLGLAPCDLPNKIS
jgi:hypothetical protein